MTQSRVQPAVTDCRPEIRPRDLLCLARGMLQDWEFSHQGPDCLCVWQLETRPSLRPPSTQARAPPSEAPSLQHPLLSPLCPLAPAGFEGTQVPASGGRILLPPRRTAPVDDWPQQVH